MKTRSAQGPTLKRYCPASQKTAANLTFFAFNGSHSITGKWSFLMTHQKGNYRRGGLVLFAASLLALLMAFTLKAPTVALASIALFGLGGAALLILAGNRS
jgi:hypothetical protein